MLDKIMCMLYSTTWNTLFMSVVTVHCKQHNVRRIQKDASMCICSCGARLVRGNRQVTPLRARSRAKTPGRRRSVPQLAAILELQEVCSAGRRWPSMTTL